MAAEWPAARGNTNNRAEYLALIEALTRYLASGRTGPLLVQGDSQLVINQMTGEWGINNPARLAPESASYEIGGSHSGRGAVSLDPA